MNIHNDKAALTFSSGTDELNKIPSPSSDDIPAIVGGTLGLCVILLIAFILTLFAIRYGPL